MNRGHNINKPDSDPKLILKDFEKNKEWFKADEEKKLEKKARIDYQIRLKMKIPPSF